MARRRISRSQSGQARLFEHEGNAAVRDGDFKLVREGRAGAWELYNLAKDRTEQTNLASKMPKKVQALSEKWKTWATTHQVLPYPGKK